MTDKRKFPTAVECQICGFENYPNTTDSGSNCVKCGNNLFQNNNKK